jgi:hypothetical protein
MKKIVLFELNEVPYKVLDQYCKDYPASFLTKALRHCRQYTVSSDDEVLHPWTTWPSLHRGVGVQRHRIKNFGQDLTAINQEFPPIWQILASHGIKTGVFGSLHSSPVPKNNLEAYAFYVPDTFADDARTHPATASIFQEFNLAMTRDSGRTVAKRIHWSSAVNMLLNCRRLGIQPSTFVHIAAQAVEEKWAPWKRIRRRTYQAVLGFDVFMQLLSATRPDFATFFTNHVASSMHRYWAAKFPDDYPEYDFDQAWRETYRYEIDFAMTKVDGFLKRLTDFVDGNPDYSIWVCASMGQAATKAKKVETQLIIKNLGKFLKAFGLDQDDWERCQSMIPQYNIRVRHGKIAALRESLKTLNVAGKAVRIEESDGGFMSLTLGVKNIHQFQPVAMIGPRKYSFEQLGLHSQTIEDSTGSTAQHVQDGVFFIYDPASRHQKIVREKIAALAIAPAILENFNLPVPFYMRETGDHPVGALAYESLSAIC